MTNGHHSVRAVAFDAFGTLIAYGSTRTNPYQRLVTTAFGGPVSRQPFLTGNVPIAVFASELGLSHLMPDIRAELDAEIEGLELFPEVEEVLGKLRAAGITIAVCSNLAFEYGPAVRRLLPALDGYVLSYEVGAAKPEPAIFQKVCDVLACSASDVLFIGDSARCDLEGPLAFGMQARQIRRERGQTLVDVLGDVL